MLGIENQIDSDIEKINRSQRFMGFFGCKDLCKDFWIEGCRVERFTEEAT